MWTVWKREINYIFQPKKEDGTITQNKFGARKKF